MPATTAAPVPYSAAVLCGGHSTRMGTDKSWLTAPGGKIPLLQHQLDRLAALPEAPVERLVSARTGQSLPSFPDDIRRLDDDGQNGPLGGLVTSLTASHTPYLFVLPVDAPHVDQTIVQTLLEAARGNSASPRSIIAATSDGLQPLIALYHRSMLPHFTQALSTGRLGLRRLLAEREIQPLLQTVLFSNEAPFTNWNTPADLE